MRGAPDTYPRRAVRRKPDHWATAPPVAAVACKPGACAPPWRPAGAGAGGGLGVVPGVGAPPVPDGTLAGAWPLRSGSRLTLDPFFTLKYAHVEVRPRRAASSGPLAGPFPPEPSTSAETMRGDTPRASTSIPRKLPLNRPLRRAAAAAKLMLSFHADARVS